MTPSSPSLNGSTPAMLTVLVGASRLPERRRRRVVLPDPLATSLLRQIQRTRRAVWICTEWLGGVMDCLDRTADQECATPWREAQGYIFEAG